MKEIRKYGIAFWDKECRVAMKESRGKCGLTKKLPIGIESFEEMRKWGFYYADKTGFIIELLENGVQGERPFAPAPV